MACAKLFERWNRFLSTRPDPWFIRRVKVPVVILNPAAQALLGLPECIPWEDLPKVSPVEDIAATEESYERCLITGEMNQVRVHIKGELYQLTRQADYCRECPKSCAVIVSRVMPVRELADLAA